MPGFVSSKRRAALGAGLLFITLTWSAVVFADHVLIVMAGKHVDPGYVGQHASAIERQPFDGLVINDYLGRNLFNTKLSADSPRSLDSQTGAVSFEAAAQGLSPVKGVFKKFQYNFAKVNFNLVGPPPLLHDDAGWRVVMQSATNYARAVQANGLKGIFLDNETYLHVKIGAKSNGDYWLYDDQIALAGKTPSAESLASAYGLARRRGRELMQAFQSGYPGITVIVAHGADEGCSAWRGITGHFAQDNYLLGAFSAGMLEGASGNATFVDGGEDYDFHGASDFQAARSWRKGGGSGGFTSLGAGKCPFMDAELAAQWSRASIGFAVFDKNRARPGVDQWVPVNSPQEFRDKLVNALKASDQYTWLYTQWQDWWADPPDPALQPYIEAVEAARRQLGMRVP